MDRSSSRTFADIVVTSSAASGDASIIEPAIAKAICFTIFIYENIFIHNAQIYRLSNIYLV
jgi:hypothetical protein